MKNGIRAALAIVIGGLALSAGAQPPPQAPALAKRSTVNAVYEVPLYKSTVVPLDRTAVRVSVGNPGVADILVIRNRELYVVGKALGSTNVVVWDDSGRVAENFDIEVTHDLSTLKAKLYELMPGEKITVQSAQEQLIISGQVTSAARAAAAAELARGFLPDCIVAQSDAPGAQKSSGRADQSCKKGGIVNMLQVGGSQQVMLKVTVAEMASSVVKRLESNLNFMRFGADGGRWSGGGVAGGASFPNAESVSNGALFPIFDGNAHPIGPPQQFFQPNMPIIDGTGVFLSYLRGNTFVQAVLDISKRNGLAKILSEPTLTTMTGQEAQFISGGEFPMPVPQGGISGGVTIEFKEFGVGLKFTPVVLDSGRINMALNVNVSEISSDNAVAINVGNTTSTFLIPSLTKRNVMSTVEVGDGQTIGIAGLINDNMREFVQKFPVLGDLPIVGALFRSQEYRSGQTELVIFVTPHLARSIQPGDYRLPTDTFVPPGDLEFYLLGKMGWQKDRPRQQSGSWAKPGATRPQSEGPKGTYGHDLGKPATTSQEKGK
jgi:pilus assembly protein CpaC